MKLRVLMLSVVVLGSSVCAFARNWEDKTNERIMAYRIWLTQAEADYELGVLPQSIDTRNVLDRAQVIERLLFKQFCNYKQLYNSWGSRKSLKFAKQFMDRNMEDLDNNVEQLRALYHQRNHDRGRPDTGDGPELNSRTPDEDSCAADQQQADAKSTVPDATASLPK